MIVTGLLGVIAWELSVIMPALEKSNANAEDIKAMGSAEGMGKLVNASMPLILQRFDEKLANASEEMQKALEKALVAEMAKIMGINPEEMRMIFQILQKLSPIFDALNASMSPQLNGNLDEYLSFPLEVADLARAEIPELLEAGVRAKTEAEGSLA